VPWRQWLSFAFCALTFAAMIGQGTFSFFRREDFWPWDSLARSLRRLRADVELRSIWWEGTVRDGKHFIPNYGPFPALLRFFPDLLFPSLNGRWSRLSCWLAAVVALAAFGWTVRCAAERNDRLSFPSRDRLIAWSLLGFTFATPVFYLMTNARMYHETLLWSVASSMVATAFAWGIADGRLRDPRGLAGLSAAVGAVVLNRMTFGLAFHLLVLAWIGLWLGGGFPKPAERRSSARLTAAAIALAVLPLVAADAVLLWYNYQKFGSCLCFTSFKGYFTDPATYGGLYNWRRLPSTLAIYFGFTPRYFTASFPFLRFAPIEYFRPELFYHYREEAIAFWLASGWLAVAGVIGIRELWRGGFRRYRAEWIWTALLWIQVGGILTGFLATQRYEAELIPLSVLLYAFALRTQAHPGWTRWLLPVLAVSAYVTIATACVWWASHPPADGPSAIQSLQGLFS
jgi:hypothetical protein